MSKRVVIVGGGVTGLAAAYELLNAKRGLDVTVLEAAPRVGGLIHSEHAGDFLLEHGPESLVAEKPEALELAGRLGLQAEILPARAEHQRTFVVYRRKLLPIPFGVTVVGTRHFAPLLRSPLLTLKGQTRAMIEPFIPKRADSDSSRDESIASFITRRFGPEFYERIGEPLTSGIYGANPNTVSMRAALPKFVALEQRYGSVYRGLRAELAARAKPGGQLKRSGFVSFRNGMSTLIGALVHQLKGHVRIETRVERIKRLQSGWRCELESGESVTADALIVALPTSAAAKLLEPLDAELTRLLASIPYTSSAAVNLAFKRAAVSNPLHGFGFVVPEAEASPLLACTWASSKYAHRAPRDSVLVRAYVGEARPAALAEGDDALVALALEHLRPLIGVHADPVLTRVHRYTRAMPHYTLTHRSTVAAIRAALARHPTLDLAGNAYEGVGIADSVRSAHQAVQRILTAL